MGFVRVVPEAVKTDRHPSKSVKAVEINSYEIVAMASSTASSPSPGHGILQR